MAVVSESQQKRQGQVVPENMAIIDALQFRCFEIHRVAGNGRGLSQIDDFRERSFVELLERRAECLEHSADRILRQGGQTRARQQLDHVTGKVAADLALWSVPLFRHFSLLPQFVPNPLEALADHRLVYSCCQSQSRRGPAAVIPALAELPVFR